MSAEHRCGCHTPPARWTGEAACHCSCCGVTFAGITVFDDHQVDGKCRTGRAMIRRGYREVRPGILGRPVSTDDPATARSRDEKGRLE